VIKTTYLLSVYDLQRTNLRIYLDATWLSTARPGQSTLREVQ
jgi:hypothetical protein